MKRSLTLGIAFAVFAPMLHAESCLLPVEYETPRSELELRQPYRLASETLIYPGYPWLVVSPTNRYPLHTIRGNRLEELRADWPKTGLWQYRDTAVRPDGTVLGFGRRPNRIYQLSDGARAFRVVDLPEYTHAIYEPHRDVALLMTKHGALLEWDGAEVQPSHLTGMGGGQNVVLPRYIPEFDLWLSFVDGALLARRAGEDQEWGEIGGDVGKWWGHRLADAPYFASTTERLLSFVLGGTAFSFQVPDSGLPSLAYQVEGQFELVSSDGEKGLILRRHPTVRRGAIAKLLGLRDRESWQEPLIVRSDGLESAAKLPVSETPSASMVQLPKRNPHRAAGNSMRYTPPLFDLPDGRYFFDGTHRVPVPHLSEQNVGRYVRWFNWQSRIWALTGAGWHEFMPDLSLRSIASPFDDIGRVFDVDVAQSAQHGGLVFTGEKGAVEGAMWITRDGTVFERAMPTGSPVRRYLSDIPNRPFALVLGADGLYLFNENCEGD